MAEPRKTPDWELAERLYRAGALTLRQIAEQVGCTHGAIRKRAQSKGWERDLTQRVRETVRAKVSRGEVSKVSTPNPVDTEPGKPIPENEIVDGAVAATLLALNSHQHIIGRLKAVANTLLDDLEAENAVVTDKAAGVVRLPLKTRAEIAKRISETAGRAVLIEREALGLGNNSNDGIEAWLDSLT